MRSVDTVIPSNRFIKRGHGGLIGVDVPWESEARVSVLKWWACFVPTTGTNEPYYIARQYPFRSASPVTIATVLGG